MVSSLLCAAGLAAELLDTPDDMLELTARKIKTLFKDAIGQARNDGTTTPELYAVCLPLRLRFKAILGLAKHKSSLEKASAAVGNDRSVCGEHVSKKVFPFSTMCSIRQAPRGQAKLLPSDSARYRLLCEQGLAQVEICYRD